ncbi:hypothetical protein AVEN_68251-1 [Araneus ventricosus]|uniref:Uncharacterized protein n=1 Tax=Araneus ventricosus TaxID=182803 RepID=A0A4Y2S851_ARAVE|nr:hypothetical protein AVEN_68251-1 [Araneus ventricosus]
MRSGRMGNATSVEQLAEPLLRIHSWPSKVHLGGQLRIYSPEHLRSLRSPLPSIAVVPCATQLILDSAMLPLHSFTTAAREQFTVSRFRVLYLGPKANNHALGIIKSPVLHYLKSAFQPPYQPLYSTTIITAIIIGYFTLTS